MCHLYYYCKINKSPKTQFIHDKKQECPKNKFHIKINNLCN